MVTHPFFCLKIGYFKQVLQIRQILPRLGIYMYFPDLGILRKVPWHIAQRRLRYAKVAQTMA
jgi:hypothetical protein